MAHQRYTNDVLVPLYLYRPHKYRWERGKGEGISKSVDSFATRFSKQLFDQTGPILISVTDEGEYETDITTSKRIPNNITSPYLSRRAKPHLTLIARWRVQVSYAHRSSVSNGAGQENKGPSLRREGGREGGGGGGMWVEEATKEQAEEIEMCIPPF